MGQTKSKNNKIHTVESLLLNPITPLWKTIRRRMLEKDIENGKISLFGTLYKGRIVYR